MCPNDNPFCNQLLLPKRLDSLFDNEAESDVTFLVGPEPETWRFPGHRAILADANPVFRAMLQGPLADSGPTVAIHDIDGRAFDLLLRFLYREDVHLQSVSTALATLYAAHKYLCAGLVRSCVAFLNENINISTVLEIYQHVRIYCNQEELIKRDRNLGLWIASAPPIDNERHNDRFSVGVDCDPNDNLETMTCLCSSLLHNCLYFIDSNADKVLAEESLEDLSSDALREISQRNTLMVSSEMILFSALERWCNRECKRCQMELSAENRRSVLGEELLFSVRYLLMNSQSFLSGPMQSGLLDQAESTVLMSYILHTPITTTAPSLKPDIIEIFRKPRRKPYTAPIIIKQKKKDKLTSNHGLKNTVNEKGEKVKKKKKEKKQKRKDIEGSPQKKMFGFMFLRAHGWCDCLYF
uniref:BTB domain-containing protein n=1 Tax=Clastoptera arizonana TaxID=38151 RepID=A0A1B6DBP6_9HEMI